MTYLPLVAGHWVLSSSRSCVTGSTPTGVSDCPARMVGVHHAGVGSPTKGCSACLNCLRLRRRGKRRRPSLEAKGIGAGRR